MLKRESIQQEQDQEQEQEQELQQKLQQQRLLFNAVDWIGPIHCNSSN